MIKKTIKLFKDLKVISQKRKFYIDFSNPKKWNIDATCICNACFPKYSKCKNCEVFNDIWEDIGVEES